MSDQRGMGLKGWLSGPRKPKTRHDPRPDGSIDQHRVAVLPFANVSPDPQDVYFADGLTEELISTMSKIRELSVISRTSIMQYKDQRKAVGDIGRELNAGTILEGSVRKAGNRVRVTIQMIDANHDQHLWADSYDRELQDIFAIQSEIAQRVVSELRVQLLSSEKQDIERKPTASVEAYQLYLKGRYLFYQLTKREINEAIGCFKKGIELDSKCAIAYAGISDCYHWASHRSWFPPEEAFPRMRDYATRALEIDPRLAEAHAALGAVYFHYDWKWKEAERELIQATELKPSYELVHEMHSYLLAILGRTEESYELARRGAELSPQYLSLWLQAGFGQSGAMLSSIKLEDSIRQLSRIAAANPDDSMAHEGLGFALYRGSRTSEALEEMQKAVTLSKGEVSLMASQAFVLAMAGKRNEATSILNDLQRLSTETYVSNVQLACILHSLGREGEAFANLEKAYRRRAIDLPDIRLIPEMRSLREDQRWGSIETGMGLR